MNLNNEVWSHAKKFFDETRIYELIACNYGHDDINLAINSVDPFLVQLKLENGQLFIINRKNNKLIDYIMEEKLKMSIEPNGNLRIEDQFSLGKLLFIMKPYENELKTDDTLKVVKAIKHSLEACNDGKINYRGPFNPYKDAKEGVRMESWLTNLDIAFVFDCDINGSVDIYYKERGTGHISPECSRILLKDYEKQEQLNRKFDEVIEKFCKEINNKIEEEKPKTKAVAKRGTEARIGDEDY